MARKARDTEVDAYVFIKAQLRALGWDTRNPARVPEGQVYTQNECLADPEIQRCLVLQRPENVVKVRESTLWILEAKRSHGELQKALSEAEEYARLINDSSQTLQAKFITGVAGNDIDTFVMRTHFLRGNTFVPVKMNGVEITGFLSPSDCDTILRSGVPDITNPPIDEKFFLSRAEYINEVLHLGAVNPHQRAGVMAALLLSMLSDTDPNIEERSLTVLIGDINNRVESVLRRQGKSEFFTLIRLTPPVTQDNHVKYRRALVKTIQELNVLNIRSAMNSGVDWLGAFYEVFLKYANWAQDLGIVLTPRHVTRYIAEVMDIKSNDIVYDPTCGTGGFLVAAFDYVKQNANPTQLSQFKQYSVFGVEQDPGIAALAVVNMIFRGDGKNNIVEGNCFAQFLEQHVVGKVSTARYTSTRSEDPPVTKVMMNPPFALQSSEEKEYKFVNQALEQMQDGAILFTVLPYSVMVRPHGYLNWRQHGLLDKHTLLAVVTFPSELFYPVGVTSVGVFIKKGIRHSFSQSVLWVRAMSDGLVISKGRRLPSARTGNDLESVKAYLRAFIHNPSSIVPNVHQRIKATPIDENDESVELVPEVYLEQEQPTHDEVVKGLRENIRNTLAYLIKINRVVLQPELLLQPVSDLREPQGWKLFLVTDLFDLDRGDFHSIADLDPGPFVTISRMSTDNGFVGFYDKPDDQARIWGPGTITVSSVYADAFVQPVPFIATDNVVLCVLKPEYQSVSIAARFFIPLMLNLVKWRYSYGRQAYKGKYATTEIMLPVTNTGDIDWEYMETAVQNTQYWPIVNAAFEQNEEEVAEPETEEDAIQKMRDMLAAGGGSAEFQNFADGMKKALSTSKPKKE